MKKDEPKRCNSGGGTGASKGNIGLRMIKKSREEKKKKPEGNFYPENKQTKLQFYLTLGLHLGCKMALRAPKFSNRTKFTFPQIVFLT